MNTRHRQARTFDTAGFTLIEMMVVVGIVGVLSAVGLAGFGMFVASAKADAALVSTLSSLRVARDRAIAERRNFEVHFIPPNRIQILREELPAGSGVTTPAGDTYLEDGQKFLKVPGVSDTPDAFAGTAPIAFPGCGATCATVMSFTSEGTFVDSTGDPINGTLFIGTPGKTTSARAVTILGTTALVHPWRWDGVKWVD